MRCNYCEWRCELNGENYGICHMYWEEGGVIKERFPNRWCAYSMSSIESIPFYHVYPGSRCMTIGTAGCNMDCRYCANAYVAKENPAKLQAQMYEFTPGQLVRMAEKLGCHNIVFNVNEPTVSLPSLQEMALAAKTAGITMGCLTNAYMTEAATEIFASVFSFINISLKGLAPDFCRSYLGIPDSRPILRNIARLAATNHVEVTTPVIQSVNDHELDEIASFLAGVDREIPWHVFRLLPEHKMKGTTYPNVGDINTILERNRKILPYIYFHNFIGSDWVNTLCPRCGREVVERISLGCGGDRLNHCHCRENMCPECGYEIRMYGSRVYWNSREGAL
ncbi:MAG TPA: radical SAM protein [Methylomusa anaerophila]|uniref:Molybdenum cofactor biosynthesis protein A n=1 Tax=Methylomusa anaerophila TaxID=1930071 RepID=A0A348AFQ5_9FIRM|nr:radical SAM protein [Methylomusa anaerophila]BBB89903.1 molybdenum cofactor biosynthesis protein A [Methylomusa anaerophila]HML90563.1 radical SAM protein [Methylomusa anaerophila]